jgi:D-alanyl-lipoteichoic acid acyltransferase DltB (MBOAT superfamily)
LGISFYTFHGLSYVVDNYKRKIRPEKNFVDYSLFVSFFPLLIAGPIERATTLLPQIKSTRIFNYAKAVDGMRQILWGLFKKIVIADNAAEYVNAAFNNPDSNSGSTLVLGAVLFAIQIYCDFSGYSDIATGVARLFGIELLRNFAFPYFSKNIKEFWQRWHISLTSWFKDYIYVPMGGSRKGLIKQVRNIFVIFMLSALWHGAGWTFLAWGLLHATYFMLYVLLAKQPSKLSHPVPPVNKVIGIISTFAVTTFAWIFFRAENIGKAIDYIEGIASYSLFTVPDLPSVNLLVQLVVFLTMEWLGRKSHYAIEDIWPFRRRSLRWSFYYYLISVIYFTSNNTQPFIYFQF